jgi:hypothetical protein
MAVLSMRQTIQSGSSFLVELLRMSMLSVSGQLMKLGFRRMVPFVSMSLAEQGSQLSISNEMATMKILLSL